MSLLMDVEYTMGSRILGKRFHELAPAARAKLRREIRLPISNNYAPHSSSIAYKRRLIRDARRFFEKIEGWA